MTCPVCKRKSVLAIETIPNIEYEENYKLYKCQYCGHNFYKVKPVTKRYINEKITLLRNFGIKLDPQQMKYIRSLSTEIAVDNFAHDLLVNYEYEPEIKETKEIKHKMKGKPVLQIKDGSVIGEYCSAYRASKETGISQGDICRACNGKVKTAGKYQWKFKNV